MVKILNLFSTTSSIFRNRNVLSPHYIPAELPFRDKEVEQIARVVGPALQQQRTKNLFLYGKTGTGKTCTVKYVMREFNEQAKDKAAMIYINCRVYNSRYRIMHRLLKHFYPELEKAGFGLPFFYEKLLALFEKGKYVVVVLDEIDMVRDLDDLIYTITRSNDESEGGGISIVGISNKLSFKNELDPRSKSSLYETELIFAPYSASQLSVILEERAKLGLDMERVDQNAIQLTAIIAAKETGDARYALKLFERAAEIADKNNSHLTHKEVEAARRVVEVDLANEALCTLPENHQIALYAVVRLTKAGSRYARLFQGDRNMLMSGEVYEEYERVCRMLKRKPRSFRWFREYLSDLETLGFVSLQLSGKGVRGHTTFIKLGVDIDNVLPFFKKWENESH